MIKVAGTFILVFSFLFICNAQQSEKEYPHILKTDSTWSSEIFPFPIHFAPQIKMEGYEDAHFPPGWGKPENPEFWSYIFAWNIKGHEKFTTDELITNLQFYFDGLMQGVNKDKDIVIPATSVHLIQMKNSNYEGNVKVYDAFRSKKVITLNILVDHYFCKKENKSIVVFRFSTKPYGDTVWTMLKEVTLVEDRCNEL